MFLKTSIKNHLENASVAVYRKKRFPMTLLLIRQTDTFDIDLNELTGALIQALKNGLLLRNRRIRAAPTQRRGTVAILGCRAPIFVCCSFFLGWAPYIQKKANEWCDYYGQKSP